MIFKPEMCEAILDGRKTVTRRPLKGGQCKYEVGKTYAVQPGRGKHAVGRIHIEDVDIRVLGHIDNRDAVREGFANKGEFMAYWRKLYHGQFFRGQLVWRIQFRPVDEGLSPAERVGCCLASRKEDCTRPPCPCNLDAWTADDRNALEAQAFADAAAQRIREAKL